MQYAFEKKTRLSIARLIFDSDLNRKILNMPSYYPLDIKFFSPPASLVKSFRIDALINGSWQTLHECSNNYQRFVKIPLNIECENLRLTPLETWGAQSARIFSFEVS